MPDFASQRAAMVERQIAARGVRDPRILDSFRSVPRERFVDPAHAGQAYGDHPLPIEAGQTISQPYIVALMIQAAEIGPSDRVLEVGSGSGYAAAIISRIASQVIGIERHPDLVALSRSRLEALEMTNVAIEEGDGTLGHAAAAPYDAILVAASAREVPSALIDQLALGGRLVIPVGNRDEIQNLHRIRKRRDGSLDRAMLGAVRFVPLIGA